MRKLLLLCLLLLVSACATVRPVPHGSSISDVRESTYQVRVSLIVDVTQLLPKDEEGGENATEIDFVFDSPQQVATSISSKKVSENTVELNWVGTGWTVEQRGGRSFVMTAGHVCETSRFYEAKIFDWDLLTVRVVQLPVVDRSHKLVSRDNVEVTANVIRDEDLDSKFNGIDLCLMGAMADLGPPLRIADSDPKYGDRAEVVGGPRGLWGGGIAVASDVKFTGRGSVFGVNPAGVAFNGEVAPGNSGSAVVYRGHVVGLISLAAIKFPSLCHAVPHGDIKDFLRRALPSEE